MQGRQLELGVPRTNEEDLRRAPVSERWGEDETEDGGTNILRRNPMMNHLLEALERGESIGHYGRLVFAMVAHHFIGDDEVAGLLARDPSTSEQEARAMALQVRERDYNPPRPERIAEWQRAQAFPICPEGDPRNCNVYRDLRFPEGVYEQIEEFWEERAANDPSAEDRRRES
jgi:hypothetical protein